MKKIIMYTGDNCGKCKRAKMMIESCPVEVELELRNVDEDESYKEELKDVIKSSSLPTILLETKILFPTKNNLVEEDGIWYEPLIGFEENTGRIMNYLGF